MSIHINNELLFTTQNTARHESNANYGVLKQILCHSFLYFVTP